MGNGAGEEILQLGRKILSYFAALPNSLRSVYNTRFTKEKTLPFASLALPGDGHL